MTISAPIRMLTIALALLPAMATATTTSYRIPVKAKGSCTLCHVQRHGKRGLYAPRWTNLVLAKNVATWHNQCRQCLLPTLTITTKLTACKRSCPA